MDYRESLAHYKSVRENTKDLVCNLSSEDQCIQSMPDTSPSKWHCAHTSWFFETFILLKHKPGYKPFNAAYGYLFNSYYEAVGSRHPRPDRGMITRPSVKEVFEYRDFVDVAMEDLLAEDPGSEITEMAVLGLHHEQQHQELILMDIKHALSLNPTSPIYSDHIPMRKLMQEASHQNPLGQNWASHAGGCVSIGHQGKGFAFDNESPAHEVMLSPFELSEDFVTCGDWLDFMKDGGYQSAELWLSDGWHKSRENNWEAPEYWRQKNDGWHVFTLEGEKELDLTEPVSHVSYYEADAFARWAGYRLPTEVEWEACVLGQCKDGGSKNIQENAQENSQEGDILPMALWNHTASPYSAYPGFTPARGAVGEYNGKFMVNQMVMRGGCWATPAGHVRPTYRNFFHPHTRWHFSGLRLAR